MTITSNKVVAIDYTLKNSEGEIIDSSTGSTPLEYIHGRGSLITGLERELEGKQAGDEFSVVIEPADAYGERNEELIFEVPRSQFEEGTVIEEGMQFEAAAPEGSRIVTVIKTGTDSVTIDANHPLAGEKLFFDIKIIDVRDATDEELAGNPADCGCGGGCGGGCGSDTGCGSGGCCGCH